jgi:DNA-binding NarL/FixJ family response regulator
MGWVPARPARILIVDDQPVFRQAARLLLTARGYAVVGEAGCAQDALEAAARLVPDGVLLDTCLGAESGLDVARALIREYPALAVVLVSAERPEAPPQSCGVRAFVLKSELAVTDLSHFWA